MPTSPNLGEAGAQAKGGDPVSWSLVRAIRNGLERAGVYSCDRDWMADVVSHVVAEELARDESSFQLARIIQTEAAKASAQVSSITSTRIAAGVRRFLTE